MNIIRLLIVCVTSGFLTINSSLAENPIQSKFIFQPDPVKHGHIHASCIVECPDGSLIACWYEGETDHSADVHIQAARLNKGADVWSETFLLADTPGLSDNNPCMVIDKQDQLWLFYFTLLGSPEEAWETAFLRYKISTHFQDDSRPIIWDVEKDLAVKPSDLDDTIEQLYKDLLSSSNPIMLKNCEQARSRLKSQLTRKLGWTTRAHPLILSTGALLLPLASENFGIAAMAITSDGGNNWIFSKSPYGYGVEQPSVLERKDGTLVAYMRDVSPAHRIRTSQSINQGLTWSPITNTDFPNPGSGVEVMRLAGGNIILVYNDCSNDPRNSLAISMSDDEGKTWKWLRHIERSSQNERFDYPSIIQTGDGQLHVTYSYNTKTIKHVMITEEWITWAGSRF